MLNSRVNDQDTIIKSNDPIDVIKTMTDIVTSGYACTSIYVDLTNVTEDNPVRLDVYDSNIVLMMPPNRNTYGIYRFKLDHDSHLMLTINRGLSTPVYYNITIQIKNEDSYLFNIRYQYGISSTDQKRIIMISELFSRIFKNKSQFIDYVNKIAIFPYAGITDFGTLCVCRYDFFDEKAKIVDLRPASVAILDYENEINNIDNIDLEEQADFVEFLRKSINRAIRYKYKDFEIAVPKGTSSILIKFLGIPIASFLETIPHSAYFRYFRHRGISFMLSCINREDFEKWILEKSLKYDVGLE